MIFTIKTRTWIIGLFIIISGIFFSGWQLGRKRADKANRIEENALKQEIYRYSVELNDKKTYIAEKEQEILTLREAKRLGDIEKEELRKLNIKKTNELTRLKIRIDTLLKDVSNTGQIVYVTVKDSIKQPCILLPFTFQKSDEWLDLKGTYNIEQKLGIRLDINANLNIWAVVKKKDKVPSVIVTTDNPYLCIVGIKSIKIDTPRERRFGIGVSAGYGITSAFKASPFLGVGLNYNVIRF